MQLTDLVADLRAEITAWWESKLANPNLETVGPLRLITQGQEINCETDEKNLAEMSFKDLQLVFVSQGNLYSLINMRQLQILFNKTKT